LCSGCAVGWIENRTVAIEWRWAEGRDERFAEIAGEFIRLKVDVIVTTGGAAYAAKEATSVIPRSRVWHGRAAT
jgi:putative ABC transport system substrate-binding protein